MVRSLPGGSSAVAGGTADRDRHPLLGQIPLRARLRRFERTPSARSADDRSAAALPTGFRAWLLAAALGVERVLPLGLNEGFEPPFPAALEAIAAGSPASTAIRPRFG